MTPGLIFYSVSEPHRERLPLTHSVGRPALRAGRPRHSVDTLQCHPVIPAKAGIQYSFRHDSRHPVDTAQVSSRHSRESGSSTRSGTDQSLHPLLLDEFDATQQGLFPV